MKKKNKGKEKKKWDIEDKMGETKVRVMNRLHAEERGQCEIKIWFCRQRKSTPAEQHRDDSKFFSLKIMKKT